MRTSETFGRGLCFLEQIATFAEPKKWVLGVGTVPDDGGIEYETIEETIMEEGQKVKVKCLDVDNRGRIKLSIKETLPAPPPKEDSAEVTAESDDEQE